MTGADSAAGASTAAIEDRIAAAVADCPAVVQLSAGPLGQYRSYLPGHTVPGVRLEDDLVRINVIARYGPDLSRIGEQIAAALSWLVPERRVEVIVDDVDLPDSADSSPSAQPGDSPAPVPEDEQ